MKPLKIWGPWESNPSAPKNFFKNNESLKKEVVKEEQLFEDDIIEKDDIIQEVKSKILEEKVEKIAVSVPKVIDPYADILKDLK
jgi:hypothetical protein